MRRNNYDPDRLQALANERGLTQRELSERTQIPITTIHAYFGGKREAVSTRNMFLLAKAFDIPMAELVDYLSGMGNIDKK